MATAFEEVMGVRAAFSGRRQPEAGEVAIAGADPIDAASRNARRSESRAAQQAAAEATSGVCELETPSQTISASPTEAASRQKKSSLLR